MSLLVLNVNGYFVTEQLNRKNTGLNRENKADN